MFGLALLFVYVFLLSFQHFCHLAWGRGSCSLCASCMCLLAMHTLICVTFSLPSGVRDWLRLLLVVRPGLSCVHFSNTYGFELLMESVGKWSCTNVTLLDGADVSSLTSDIDIYLHLENVWNLNCQTISLTKT